MSALPFSGSSDTSPAIDGTVGAFLGLTWIAVSLRIYVRAFILKKLQSADYLIVLTQVCREIRNSPSLPPSLFLYLIRSPLLNSRGRRYIC